MLRIQDLGLRVSAWPKPSKLRWLHYHMNHSLNSLKGDYIGEYYRGNYKGDTRNLDYLKGDYIGDYYGVIKWDTRSLDYSSYMQI